MRSSSFSPAVLALLERCARLPIAANEASNDALVPPVVTAAGAIPSDTIGVAGAPVRPACFWPSDHVVFIALPGA